MIQKNYNENLVAGAAIRDDKGRRISKLFEATHPKMTVGYANNLIIPNDPIEQEFNFRQSGGGVIEDGIATIDKVKGNSVVWNQMVKPSILPPSVTKKGVSYTNNGDGSVTVNGTATDNEWGYQFPINVISGHRYLLKGCPKGGSYTSFSITDSGGLLNDEGNGAIQTASTTKLLKFCIVARKDYTLNNVVFRPLFYDLTQMFGAGNEPSTYEEFLSRKPTVADEYAYNEGTIVNNKVEKVMTTGRNLWDEEWELGSYDDLGRKVESSNTIRSKNMCACLPHTSYYWRIPNKANGSYMAFCYFYDISGALISKLPVGPSAYLTVTTPSNARFIAFSLRTEYGTTYNHDICINLSDPTINGQYFPYEEHSLDLSWVKEIKDAEGVKLFEDGMKSAGTAFDEAGKNKAVKRVGSVDLGTLQWNTSWWDGDGRLYVKLENKKVGYTNIIYPLGATYSHDGALINTIGICGNNINNYIYVGDAKAHSSASEFISSLSGVYTYYELAEPIEVEYDEKNLTYPVVAGGTEEAIASESSTAFRADIGYGIDAVKLILDLKARVKALEGK